ncbi:transglycosylase SLT domain-containing protein [Gordonia sp. CPCC 205333]|uniref:transglycosylase SLT domain-containing protein n=1 Tax=Gordonia sp. CPCC 205333 TaxID=3140790 RepID=UPI003AF375B8
MSVVSTMLHRVRVPRKHSRYVAGAVTLAVAAGVSVGSVAATEPAYAERPHQAGAPRTAPATTGVAAAMPALKGPVIEEASQSRQLAKYENNLDGWIRESLEVLRKNNIPASYDGIHRNIMRESTGNPRAINLYDSNAAAGIPSKGLLQVIDPTFAAYHVKGTAFDIWNPVSNIVAACNYAAHNYGSMDNVSAAY